MSERSIMLTEYQFDRMMRTIKYVESMQRGTPRGQDVPEAPPAVVTGEVWVKVTGAADATFKPEDTETDYYPCILTEKVVLSDYEETTHGPLASYWKDYNGNTAQEPEGRCFSLNNAPLVSGERYKATVVDHQDNQYPVLGVTTGCRVDPAQAFVTDGDFTASEAGCGGGTLSLSTKTLNCDGTTTAGTPIDIAIGGVPSTTVEVVSAINSITAECVDGEVDITLDFDTIEIKVLDC